MMVAKAPPQPLPTRGRDLRCRSLHVSLKRLLLAEAIQGHETARQVKSLPLVGRGWGEAFVGDWGGAFTMPHSNITPKTRTRARTLRHELTKAEQVMWDILRDFRPRGARFRRETPIGPYIADFSWLSARVVVEVDGDSHETDSGRRHDFRRDAFLKSQGFTVLRFDNDRVLDGPDHVVLTIEGRIAAHLTKEHAFAHMPARS